MKYSKELIEKAEECKSKEELIELAKENNLKLTEKEVDRCFEAFTKKGELSDEELDSISGGSCGSPTQSVEGQPLLSVGDKIYITEFDLVKSQKVLYEVIKVEFSSYIRSDYIYTLKSTVTGEEITRYEWEIR